MEFIVLVGGETLFLVLVVFLLVLIGGTECVIKFLLGNLKAFIVVSILVVILTLIANIFKFLEVNKKSRIGIFFMMFCVLVDIAKKISLLVFGYCTLQSLMINMDKYDFLTLIFGGIFLMIEPAFQISIATGGMAIARCIAAPSLLEEIKDRRDAISKSCIYSIINLATAFVYIVIVKWYVLKEYAIEYDFLFGTDSINNGSLGNIWGRVFNITPDIIQNIIDFFNNIFK